LSKEVGNRFETTIGGHDGVFSVAQVKKTWMLPEDRNARPAYGLPRSA
jgi:hypothetical protein